MAERNVTVSVSLVAGKNTLAAELDKQKKKAQELAVELRKGQPGGGGGGGLIPVTAGTAAQRKLGDEIIKSKERADSLRASLTQLGQTAGRVFFGGTAAITGFAAAAGGDLLGTLTGSFQLLAGSIGQAFIPTIVSVSGWLQRTAAWFKTLDGTTKQNLVSWTLWGIGIAGASWAMAKLVTIGGQVGTVLSAVWAIPVVGPIAIVTGAVIGLGYALSQLTKIDPFGNLVAFKAGEVAKNVRDLAEALARLRGGGAARPSDVEAAFEPSERIAIFRARNNPLELRRQLTQMQTEAAWQSQHGATPVEAEQMALQALEITRSPEYIAANARQRQSMLTQAGFVNRPEGRANLGPDIDAIHQLDTTQSGPGFDQDVMDLFRQWGLRSQVRQRAAAEALQSGNVDAFLPPAARGSGGFIGRLTGQGGQTQGPLLANSFQPRDLGKDAGAIYDYILMEGQKGGGLEGAIREVGEQTNQQLQGIGGAVAQIAANLPNGNMDLSRPNGWPWLFTGG